MNQEFILIIDIILYLIAAIATFFLYQKAQHRYAWFAFIPFLSFIPFFHIIKKSAWNVLWILVPVANIIFAIIWTIQWLKAFGINPWILLLYIVPFVNIFVLFYMSFSTKVVYQHNDNSYIN